VEIPKWGKNKNKQQALLTLCDEQHRIGLLTGRTVFPTLEEATDEKKKILVESSISAS
jgi:ribose 5-phosphate isomerase